MDLATVQENPLVEGLERLPGEPTLVPRVTLTLPAINAAREVVFLAAARALHGLAVA